MPSTFDTSADIPDLSGKSILVTGGNAGLGKATVVALAAHNPKCIYLCCRRRASGEALVQSVLEDHPDANIVVLELDLSDLDSVKRCAKEFQGRSEQLDILILNAGVSSTPYQKTKQGYEYQYVSKSPRSLRKESYVLTIHRFGVNHVGHALLTQLLMPTLINTRKSSPSGDVRIVVVSSKGHMFAPSEGLILNKMKTDGTGVQPLTLYGHSKLANIMFARKLAQLYPDITSTSIHPGTVKSEIWDKAGGFNWFVASVIAPVIVYLSAVTIEEGAKTQLWAATAEVGGKGKVENGHYYVPVGNDAPFGKFAEDQAKVDELWQWTNEELKTNGASGWPKI